MFAIKRVDPLSEDTVEYWTREITAQIDRSRFGIEASRSRDGERWPWQVTVWAMAAIRDVPLEKELRRAIVKALRAVPGVVAAQEGDRELWIVRGTPAGDALVAAAATVVDAYAAELRAYIR